MTWTTVRVPACAAMILCSFVEPSETARTVEPERRVLAPGEALNERLREARMTPVEAVVPEVPAAAEFGLPADSVVSVHVRLAVNHEGIVVDAESEPAALLRVHDGTIETYPGVDLSIDQAVSFEETARAGILDSRFAVDPAVNVGAGGFVRGVARVWWLVSGETDFEPSCTTTVQRSKNLLLAEGSCEPTLVSSLKWSGPQRGEFKRTDELSGDELDAARGIPAGARIPAGESGCGLLAEAPPELAVAGMEGVVQGTLIPGSRVEPHYPAELRELKIGGTVTLIGIIDKEGRVVGFLPVQAAPGFPEFLQSAMDAACQWRYEPSTMNGLPTMITFSLRVKFSTF